MVSPPPPMWVTASGPSGQVSSTLAKYWTYSKSR